MKRRLKLIREDLTRKIDSLAASKPMALLIAVRVILLTCSFASTLFSSLYKSDDNVEQLAFSLPAISVLYVLSFFSGIWIFLKGSGPIFTWFQIAVDAVTITGVIYVTGGPSSPFLFLYLPPVIVAAMMATKRSAFSLALLNGALYATLCYSLVNHWIYTADGSALEDVGSYTLFLQTSGVFIAMLLVSLLTSFLVEKIRHNSIIIEQAQIRLASFSNSQRALINDFPEALIGTDQQGIVRDINKRATDMLGSEVAAFLFKPLEKLLDGLRLNYPGGELTAPDWDRFESNFEKGLDTHRLSIQRRAINKSDGTLEGFVFLIQDVTALRTAEEQIQIQERMAKLLASRSPVLMGEGAFAEFVGESATMQAVFSLIQRVAPSDATVLISGESGTGKELVARSIHKMSTRSARPFVALNCGAMPENLIESELFGHKKGSFTGADADHSGLFRMADKGTLFLDEIGELPMHLQAKLLRALQEKRIRPVGSDRDFPVDVRIIAATNRNLKQEVEKNRFRDDLFYRLNVISINLPALRERKEDLLLLTNSILRRLAGEGNLPTIAPSTLNLLRSYNYPGNVRELENILERAVVLGGDVLLPEHLPDSVKESDASALNSVAVLKETHIIEDPTIEFPMRLDELLATVEKRYLMLALERTNGGKKRAADLLGINFRSFRYRLQKFGLSSGDEE